MTRDAIRTGAMLTALLASVTVGATSALADQTPLRPHPAPGAVRARAGAPTPLRAHPAAPAIAGLNDAATVPVERQVLPSAHHAAPLAVDATLAARDQQPAGRSRPWMEVLTLAAAALGLAAIAAATRTIRVRRQVWH